MFGREFDHDRQGPRAVFDGVAARTVVVPLQPIVDVTRQADVMTLRVAVAAKHVYQPLADAEHAGAKAILGSISCGVHDARTPPTAAGRVTTRRPERGHSRNGSFNVQTGACTSYAGRLVPRRSGVV